MRLDVLSWRSIQIGLGDVAVDDRCVDDWIVGIDDITPLVGESDHQPTDAQAERLPVEQPYPLPTAAATAMGIS